MTKMTAQDFEILNIALAFPPKEDIVNIDQAAECLQRVNELRRGFVQNALMAEQDYHRVYTMLGETFGPMSEMVQASTRSKDFFNICIKHLFDTLEIDHALLTDFITDYLAPDDDAE